ncbi:U7 snRNA-associated Sm-like protein LSm11 [Plutella xylostella]|uniref:U7 snRNA-associated Sm-like protein LSm11 n=1 Tax=Plutella xylostella TaxID=51655 RepID=UPI0020325D38|nr:U7 snRNA-associated Sm-like protein LSm11 [Plutella xylostella]
MSEDQNSDSSTSESEVSACSSSFDPMKVLYSRKTKVPVAKAPMFENIYQFDAAQNKNNEIIPVGNSELVQQREEKKIAEKLQKEKEVEEFNKQRFSQYQGLTSVPRKQKAAKNVLTRLGNMEGPLAALKDCVDRRIRIQVVTRHASGVRGVLHATLVAFDKQWNLALSDVLEVWKRKGVKKRKIPPALGTPVPRGTAASIFPVPVVTETPLGGGVWECTRHLPQLLVRGEHVVLVNIVER